MAKPAESVLRVTQFRSTIGSKPKHKGTVRALGLGRVGRSHTLPDRPEIRGMLASVPHLVTFEVVGETTTTGKSETGQSETGES